MSNNMSALTQIYSYEKLIVVVILSVVAIGIGLKLYLDYTSLKKCEEDKK